MRGIVLRDNAQHQKTVLLTVDNAVWYPFDVCGRYTVSKPSEILPELLGRDDLPQLAARYNIAPTQMAPVLVADPDCEPRLTEMQWGFVPYWADTPEIGHRLINARSETVAKKSTFRESFSRQRCVVAADGFYEWQQIPGGKQPYLLRFRGNAPFGFAGLWNRWRNSADQVLETFTILTTTANGLVEPIHGRMPVILNRQARQAWLAPQTEPAVLLQLCEPCPASTMEAIPVSNCVNNAGHDSSQCLQAVRIPDSRTLF